MARWECPFCRQTADRKEGSGLYEAFVLLSSASAAFIEATACPNPDCRRFEIGASIRAGQSFGTADFITSNKTKTWRLVPRSRAVAYPDFVPNFIRSDYEEACLIETLSPKASAALTRRCLQNIIRDYWRISKPRLIDEIDAIQSKVDDEILAALHALRNIGNIGAHPERDPSVIVDIEPGEATAMIELIELLINETYIARQERGERIARVAEIAERKKAAAQPKRDQGQAAT